MDLRFLAIASCAVLIAASAFAAEQILDGVAAVVNQEVITFSQVRELVASREMSLRQTLQGKELQDKVKEVRLSAINELVDRQLVLQEFKKAKFTMPDYAIDDQIASIIREQFKGDRPAFIRTLQAQGYTLQKFRKMETDKMIVQAMRGRSVKVNPILSPTKVEQFYQTHKTPYSTPEQVKLRMIVMKKDTTGAETQLAELRTKIGSCDDFAKMAETYSEDSTKDVGGDWGWIERGTLNESLAEPAFALKPGGVSKVLQVGNNYYLLYVEARRNAETKPLEAVRDEVEKLVLQTERQEAQQKWIDGLRAKAYVRIY